MAEDTTPKKSAIEGLSINSSEKLIEGLEAVAGLQESRAIRAGAEADMINRGFEIEEPDEAAPEDNDQQQAMALLLKKYIKRLISIGALEGDRSQVF